MSEKADAVFEVVKEETLYRGPLFNLKQVDLKTPGGSVVKRDIIQHKGSVGILPITNDGNFILVKQYRAPAGDVLLELPAGTLESGEDPDECALRELSEEIGQTASSMRRVAGFYLAPGWATEFMHAYFATGLSPHAAQPDDDEDIELVTLSPEEALDAITNGEIMDCKSVALIGLYFAEKHRGGGV